VAERDETPADEAERWASVPTFNYEVSDLGRVRRKGRLAALRAVPNSRGYLSVGLYDAPKSQHSRYVHRLVLEAFVGMRPEGLEARHLNGDKTDNRLANLAWGTREENAADKRLHGTHRERDTAPRARLTSAAVAVIRRLPSEVSNRDIAALTGVDVSTVACARRGDTWGPEALSSPTDTAALPTSTKDADPLTSFSAPVDAPCAPSNGEERAPSEDERRTA
jgi:hypothetical protein